MIVQYPFKYIKNEIPPRCRKPREVVYEAEYAVEIREVSDEEAPIAIIQRLFGYDGEPRPELNLEYRWYDGQLWTAFQQRWNSGDKIEPYVFRVPGEAYYPGGYLRSSYDACIKAIDEWAADYLFIGGVCYRVALEPYWRIVPNRGYEIDVCLAYFAQENERHKRDNIPANARERMLQVAGEYREKYKLPVHHRVEFDVLIDEAVQRKVWREYRFSFNGPGFVEAFETKIEATSPDHAVELLKEALNRNASLERPDERLIENRFYLRLDQITPAHIVEAR